MDVRGQALAAAARAAVQARRVPADREPHRVGRRRTGLGGLEGRRRGAGRGRRGRTGARVANAATGSGSRGSVCARRPSAAEREAGAVLVEDERARVGRRPREVAAAGRLDSSRRRDRPSRRPSRAAPRRRPATASSGTGSCRRALRPVGGSRSPSSGSPARAAAAPRGGGDDRPDLVRRRGRRRSRTGYSVQRRAGRPPRRGRRVALEAPVDDRAAAGSVATVVTAGGRPGGRQRGARGRRRASSGRRRPRPGRARRSWPAAASARRRRRRDVGGVRRRRPAAARRPAIPSPRTISPSRPTAMQSSGSAACRRSRAASPRRAGRRSCRPLRRTARRRTPKSNGDRVAR